MWPKYVGVVKFDFGPFFQGQMWSLIITLLLFPLLLILEDWDVKNMCHIENYMSRIIGSSIFDLRHLQIIICPESFEVVMYSFKGILYLLENLSSSKNTLIHYHSYMQ